MSSVKPVEVIEAKIWRNVRTGATASIYGAVPYHSDKDKADWQIESCGFTWRCTRDNTVGLGRKAVATREEAQAIADKINAHRAKVTEEHRKAWPESYR